jgi:hypothetical protein
VEYEAQAQADWLEVRNIPSHAAVICHSAEKVGIDAHTRPAQMGNTIDVNANEYAVATFEQKFAAVRLAETVVVQ